MMAEVNHFYASQNTLSSDTNTSYAEPTNTCKISGASLSANTKYLIIARAKMGGGDANSNFWCRISTADDANVATVSTARIEPTSASQTSLQDYMFVRSYTTDSSPADIMFEQAGPGSVSTYMDQMTLTLIDLDDLGSGNYIEATDDTAGNMDEAGTQLANISTLSGSTEYLFLGYLRAAIGSTSTSVGVELRDGSTVKARSYLEGEDANDFRLFGVQGAWTTAATPNTASIYGLAEGGTAGDSRASYLIAIKTEAFADFVYAWTATGTTNSVTTTPTTFETLSGYTPTTAGNHLVIGAASFADLGTILATVTVAGTESLSGDIDVGVAGQYGATDEARNSIVGRVSISSSSDIDLDLADLVSVETPTYMFVAVLNLNLADANISASAVTGVTTVPAPAVMIAAVAVAGVTTINDAITVIEVTYYPTAVAGVGSIPTPTTSTGSTIGANAVAGVATIPTPDLPTFVGVTAVTGIAFIPTPTVETGGAPTEITAVTVAGTTVIPGITLSAGATISAVTVAGTSSISTPTLSTGVSVTVTAVAGETTVPPIAPLAGTSLTATAVTSYATIPSPSVAAGTGLTPPAVAGQATIASPSVAAGGGLSLNPSAVAGVTVIAGPGLSTSSTITATASSGTAVIPAPFVEGVTNLQVNVVVGAATIGDPTVATGTVVAMTAVTGTAAIPVPTVSTGTTISAVAVVGMGFVPTPVAVGGDTALPTAIVGVGAIPTPVVSSGSMISPMAVVGTGSVLVPVSIVALKVKYVRSVSSATKPVAYTSREGSEISDSKRLPMDKATTELAVKVD